LSFIASLSAEVRNITKSTAKKGKEKQALDISEAIKREAPKEKEIAQ